MTAARVTAASGTAVPVAQVAAVVGEEQPLLRRLLAALLLQGGAPLGAELVEGGHCRADLFLAARLLRGAEVPLVCVGSGCYK